MLNLSSLISQLEGVYLEFINGFSKLNSLLRVFERFFKNSLGSAQPHSPNAQASPIQRSEHLMKTFTRFTQ